MNAYLASEVIFRYLSGKALIAIVRVIIGVGLLPAFLPLRRPNMDPFRITAGLVTQVVRSDCGKPMLRSGRVLKGGPMDDPTDGGLPDVAFTCGVMIVTGHTNGEVCILLGHLATLKTHDPVAHVLVKSQWS
ncbi:hypothetical protein [Pseudomonas sp. ANT_H12B]|uniref:hypothetical protein n=1 Tax=Pseudomonas sp. ANT_H12B TaxID=2597348 RepID=UPI002116C846|nr:hypothetical protein [Pseudomonas sp. ANT_H12B]